MSKLEYVVFPSQDSALFFLDMNNSRPMNLILTSATLSYATFSLNKDVNLYVSLSLICPTLSLLLPQPSSPEPHSFPSLCEAVF